MNNRLRKSTWLVCANNVPADLKIASPWPRSTGLVPPSLTPDWMFAWSLRRLLGSTIRGDPVGQVWHVPETGGPPGLEPGFYCEDEAALATLLADPTVEHASVPAGAPSPLVHGQRARIATPAQAEVLRAHESRPAPIHPARTIPFDDLIAGLERAWYAGFVTRKMCRATDLLIYCYTQRCVYDHGWDPFSLLARGLIVDPAAGTVVATPFPKFFNLGERGAPVAPSMPFDAFEKLDGSLIIAFHHAGRWRTATKGAFDSPQAVWAQARLDAIDTSGLVPGTTYLFEAIYPENVVVVRYQDASLSLLAAYFADGRELPSDFLYMVGFVMGFPVAERHSFDSMADLVARAAVLSRDREGFVIRFADGARVKVKGDEYKRLHAVISRCTPLAVWDVMLAGGDLDAMRRDLPEEFWGDFDEIANILQARFIRLAASVCHAAEDATGLSDKELGLRLAEVPDPVRPFLFPFRKATTDEAREKLRQAMLRTIRPTNNLLDGYGSSAALDRVMEAA